MRENKHSKKLAFAVLAATAAVGVSAVAPVSAASINTADGLIVTSDTPVSSNVAVPTTVVTGSGNIAVGQQNEVRSTSGSTSAFGNQNYVNGQDANAFGDGNAAFGHYAQVFGDTNEANGNQTVAYGYNNIVGEFQAAATPTDSHRVDPTTTANRSAAVGVQNKIAGGAGSSMGTGGMYTKIKAAHMATNSGIHMIIASGESDNSLRKVCKGENIGTLFVANDQGVSQKHHWVAYGKRLSGSITIDEGCTKAVLNHGASILPAGIIEVDGSFEPGDTVSIIAKGKEIARGLVNYSSTDLLKIRGYNTQDIARVLEIDTTYDEVVHRNNLVIIH